MPAMSNIRTSDYNATELVIHRLHAAGWITNLPPAKGYVRSELIHLEWTRKGLIRAKRIHAVLSELDYFSKTDIKKNGELDILCCFIGMAIK
jgi:hypothetical protein